MDFITIEDLVEQTGICRRTIDTKLLALWKEKPELQTQLTTKTGRNRTLYKLEVIELLATLKRHTKPDNTTPIDPTKPKPVRKMKAPRAVTAKVIPIPVEGRTQNEEKELFQQVMIDYESGKRGIVETCKAYNVSQNDFWYWINNRPDFREIWDSTKTKQNEMFYYVLADTAKQSLLKLVQGYTTESEVIAYDQKMGPDGRVIDIPVEKRFHRRHHSPSFNAILLSLTNRDPENWKKFFPTNPITVPMADPIESMTDEQLTKYLEEAKEKGLT